MKLSRHSQTDISPSVLLLVSVALFIVQYLLGSSSVVPLAILGGLIDILAIVLVIAAAATWLKLRKTAHDPLRPISEATGRQLVKEHAHSSAHHLIKTVTRPVALAATVAVIAGLWLLGDFVRAPWACITAAQASSEIGRHTCVTFQASHIGTSWKGDVFLDEKTDYAQGFVAYIPSGSGVTLAQAQNYLNKDITVTGIVTSFRGAPQIMVSDPSQVQIASTWGSWILAAGFLIALIWLHGGWYSRKRAASHSQQDELVEGASSVAVHQSELGPEASLPSQEKVRAPISHRPELDSFYEPALRAVYERGMASTALLQYRLQIPYATAAYLIQRMEDEQLVGPIDGARPRLVNTSKLKTHIKSR